MHLAGSDVGGAVFAKSRVDLRQAARSEKDVCYANSSILLPHKHIPEHCGPYKGVIRYHLALKVPHSSTDCQIRVGNEIRHWQEGKSLIFDDTFPHEAWNQTNDIRVVLFVDFLRPLKFPLSLVNQFIIKLVSISPYVQKGKQNLEAWKDQIN